MFYFYPQLLQLRGEHVCSHGCCVQTEVGLIPMFTNYICFSRGAAAVSSRCSCRGQLHDRTGLGDTTLPGCHLTTATSHAYLYAGNTSIQVFRIYSNCSTLSNRSTCFWTDTIFSNLTLIGSYILSYAKEKR